MREITDEEAEELGISTKHHLMENGEKRFRLVAADGSSYIRTEGSSEGAWQNSHFHKCKSELYIVQRGWMMYAELTNDGLVELKPIGEGEHVFVKPLKHHNIYMSPLAVTHVVKFGDHSDEVDWHESPGLDELTKPMDLTEMHRQMESRISGDPL